MKLAVEFSKEQVVHWWLKCQGLLQTRQPAELNSDSFVTLLRQVGGLQVDSVNVVDRAHYLTLWSRFGEYPRDALDRWIYNERLAYEYWGHEASILPASHFPYGLRRMRGFPPARWADAAFWKYYETSPDSKRRVLRLLKELGPLESLDFERTARDLDQRKILGWGALLPKEDKRSLALLWHAGKVAISKRKHFRKVYDLATNVYPQQVQPVSVTQYQDSWLMMGLSGNGIASESHLANYITGPNLKAEERKTVIERNLKRKKVIEVRVKGFQERFFALAEHLDLMNGCEEPEGTTVICPFDSLLWQRKRAEQLMDFRYRVEIYLPQSRREYGYYVMPILHQGRLVGRLDPKFHREAGVLEIRSLHLEPWFKRCRNFKKALHAQLYALARFLGGKEVIFTKKF